MRWVYLAWIGVRRHESQVGLAGDDATLLEPGRRVRVVDSQQWVGVVSTLASTSQHLATTDTTLNRFLRRKRDVLI